MNSDIDMLAALREVETRIIARIDATHALTTEFVRRLHGRIGELETRMSEVETTLSTLKGIAP